MDFIKRPLLTEKHNNLSEKYNRYSFVVDKNANKIEIKKAIEDYYGVSVERVNTCIYAGKRKQRFTKTGIVQGKTSAYKKAIVFLKAGETIDFFSNI